MASNVNPSILSTAYARNIQPPDLRVADSTLDSISRDFIVKTPAALMKTIGANKLIHTPYERFHCSL